MARRKQVRSQKGAIRTPLPSTKPRPWGRVFLSLIFLSICVFGIKKTNWTAQYERLTAINTRPIKHVSVEGEFEYISKSLIQSLLAEKLVNDFVDLKITDLQRDLKMDPWIANASVFRVWPDSLVVKIAEEKPIALWGSEGFINRFGSLVVTTELKKIEHLPKLYGSAEKSDDVVKHYLSASKIVAAENLSISEFSIDETNAWRIEIDNTFELFVGESSVSSKLENFLFVYSRQLKSKKNAIKQIDLRYSSGMAVSWRENNTHLLTSQRE